MHLGCSKVHVVFADEAVSQWLMLAVIANVQWVAVCAFTATTN